MALCRECGNTTQRARYIYCSNRCQMDYQYRTFVADWQHGKVDGGIGQRAKNVSGHVRRYLSAKFGEKCSLCD